ncbi:MAG: IS200/IS605 family transposase [Candidatus Micrarchaeota archaeon]
MRETAARWSVVVLELSVMSDHVHALVSLPPSMSVSKALNVLKGSSAKALFQLEPKFRLRYYSGHFWSRGSFYRSVGSASLETVAAYVCCDNDPWQQTLAAY